MANENFFEANRRIFDKSNEDFFDSNRRILNNNSNSNIGYMNNVSTLKNNKNLGLGKQQIEQFKSAILESGSMSFEHRRNVKVYTPPKEYNQIRGARRKKSLIRRIAIGTVAGIITISSVSLILKWAKEYSANSILESGAQSFDYNNFSNIGSYNENSNNEVSDINQEFYSQSSNFDVSSSDDLSNLDNYSEESINEIADINQEIDSQSSNDLNSEDLYSSDESILESEIEDGLSEDTEIYDDSNEEGDSYENDDENNQTLEEIRDFLNNTEAGYYVFKYSEMYGIDPHVMAAICKIESFTLNHEDCIPGGRFYTGYGVGITELDFDKEYTEEHEVYVTGYNYVTGQEDSVRLNMENAVNLETNIQISAMLFQKNIDVMKGNILLAIQCHNYGAPMTELVLDVNGLYDYIEDYSDMRWKDAMLDAHLHPYNYLSNDVWDFEKLGEYGGRDYVDRVLQFCEKEATYRYGDTIYTVDLKTGNVINTENVSSRTM